LDELGVEYDTYDLPNGERGVSWIDDNGVEWEAVQQGKNFEIHALQLVTPEQAIAATVGVTEDEADARDLMEAIRNDDGVRYSMDEVMDIMRKDVAAKVGNAGYGIQFADWCEFPPETMVGETVFDSEGNAIGWIVDAMVGKDIEHYDGSGRRGTVAILQGGRKPEEVMFVHDEGGVTHYLPEDAGTCHMEVKDNIAESEGMGDVWLECDRCHWQMTLEPTTPRFKYCPNCRARIKEEAE